jgi:superfamily II DNA helicase RecQ
VALDSFWNLAAELTQKKVKFRFIGLTATLRTGDVIDIMNRLGTSAMRVSRTSCYREGLNFEFKIVGTSDDSMCEAEKVVNSGGEHGKILIFVTGIETCVKLGAMLQRSYKGCGSVICLV